MAAIQEDIRASQWDAARVAQQEDVRREIEERARQRTGSKVFNCITLFVCCVASFASVWFVAAKGSQVYRLSYGNTALQSKIQQQKTMNASLNADVDQLKQPSRILNVALHQLHMQYKNPIVIPSKTSGK